MKDNKALQLNKAEQNGKQMQSALGWFNSYFNSIQHVRSRPHFDLSPRHVLEMWRSITFILKLTV